MNAVEMLIKLALKTEPQGQKRELLKLQLLKVKWNELHGQDVIPINTPREHLRTNRAAW